MVVSELVLRKTINHCAPCTPARNVHVLLVEIAHDYVRNDFATVIRKIFQLLIDLLAHMDRDLFTKLWIALFIGQIGLQYLLNY